MELFALKTQEMRTPGVVQGRIRRAFAGRTTAAATRATFSRKTSALLTHVSGKIILH
jgi:hypothetical protein